MKTMSSMTIFLESNFEPQDKRSRGSDMASNRVKEPFRLALAAIKSS